MPSARRRIFSLPSLAQASSPTSERSHDSLLIWRLHKQAAELDAHLARATAMLSMIPGPTPADLAKLPIGAIQELLGTIAAALGAMPYSARLAAWVNDARIISACAVNHFDKGLSNLQLLARLRPTTRTYRNYLSELRRSWAELNDTVAQLLDKLDAYWEEAGVPHLHVIRNLPTDAMTPMHSQSYWEQGRQAGLREAQELIDGILLAQRDSLPQALRVDVEQVLNDLSVRLNESAKAAEMHHASERDSTSAPLMNHEWDNLLPHDG